MTLNNFFQRPRIYLVVVAALAAMALSVAGKSAYRGAKAVEERALIGRVETIALSLDPREIAFLAGDASDVKNPFYASLKKRFENLRAANEDTRFIYLAGARRDDGIFFYLDSEPKSSLNYSPPGQLYAEASPVFHRVFETGRSRFDGPLSDRWGEWVSAFTAINHPLTGRPIAVLGIDIGAGEYRRRISLAMAPPILIIALLFLLFLIGFIRHNKEREIIALKGEFVSIASHDLRSPLTGLSWAVQALLRNKAIAGYPDVQDLLKTMDKASRGLLAAVQAILDFSRLEGGKSASKLSESIDLRSLIAEVIETLVLFAREKNVAIFLDGDWPEKIMIAGDRERIKRAISNIISNSVKYSPEGEMVRVSYAKKEASHIVGVANSGPSIPPSEQGKIFSKFFRASDAGTASQPGTGLGLYFAKRFIEAHGGRMWFDSKEQRGVTFYIALPV